MNIILNSKKITLSMLVSTAFFLTACGGDRQDVTLDSVSPTVEQAAQSNGSPVYDLVGANIPYPNDILFSGSTDGTLNLTVKDVTDISDPKNSLNELDGFSTSGAISVGLSKAMDKLTVASAVRLYEVVTNPALGNAVVGYSATLVAGVDYFPTLSADGKRLLIVPLKPLKAKTSYMVVVTNSLQDVDGKPATADLNYSNMKKSTALVNADGKSQIPGMSDALAAKLEGIRKLTQAQLTVATTVEPSLSKGDIVMSWSFSTQSTTDVINTITTSVINTSLVLQDTQMTTASAGVPHGTSKIYAGTIDVPYYQTVATTKHDTAPLTSKWSGQTGLPQTRYTVLAGDSPKATTTLTIPVMATIPAGGCNNCGVVIYQHGITSNRATVLAVADAYAAAGMATIAIDMPMHGITDASSASGFRMSGKERTFDVDFVTQNADNSILATTPDGVQDSSGRHFIQLTSLLTTRDNLRQAISDLVQLKASLATAVGIDFDENNVHFLGHSLGGMVGAGFVNIATDIKTATFAMSGTQAAYVIANSPAFAPAVEAGLATKGILKGSAEYAAFELAAQTVVDSADPVNVINGLTMPSLMLEVVGDGNSGTVDQVVPNSVAHAPLAGTDPWVRIQGLKSLVGTGAVTDSKGVIKFTAGDHGSLLSPTASATTTKTMQEAIVSFAASSGAGIQISSNSTIKQ